MHASERFRSNKKQARTLTDQGLLCRHREKTGSRQQKTGQTDRQEGRQRKIRGNRRASPHFSPSKQSQKKKQTRGHAHHRAQEEQPQENNACGAQPAVIESTVVAHRDLITKEVHGFNRVCPVANHRRSVLLVCSFEKVTKRLHTQSSTVRLLSLTARS